MTIPDYQTVMLPVLKFLGDEEEHSFKDLVEHISNEFSLTEEEKQDLLPSGTQPIINNRVGWARTYMKKAGLLEDPQRGYVRITKRGLEVIKQNPPKIDIHFLAKFPEFIEFRSIKKEESYNKEENEEKEQVENKTPDELMENGFNSIQANLSQELLDRIRTNSPTFFENVVLKLLEAMGYGRGKVTGQSGDGGIDGFINQDKLGLDKIFFQAKRFGEGNPVSASMLRDFVGTLDMNGVNKGVFITTSKFPKDAVNTISKTHKSIVLIDGTTLVRHMVDFDIGVSTEKIYKIKRVDSDFFVEE